MANALYDTAKEGLLDGSVAWASAASATVPVTKVALVRGYAFSASHRFMSDVTGAGGTLVAVTAALAGKTNTLGVARASNTTFGAVASGAACPALIIYQASAIGGGADVAATAQRVIGFIDTATNLPITPNGGTLDVVWDSGVNGIFKL